MIPSENLGVLEKIGYGSVTGGGYQHPPPPAYGFSSAGSYGYGHAPKGGKKNIALSALTLLAFLFFLHILQTCVQDHMTTNTGTQVLLVNRFTGDAIDRRDDRGEEAELETADQWDVEGGAWRVKASVGVREGDEM